MHVLFYDTNILSAIQIVSEKHCSRRTSMTHAHYSVHGVSIELREPARLF